MNCRWTDRLEHMGATIPPVLWPCWLGWRISSPWKKEDRGELENSESPGNRSL